MVFNSGLLERISTMVLNILNSVVQRASEALIESGAQAFDFEYNLIESSDSDHIRKFIPGYEEGFANMISHSEKP